MSEETYFTSFRKGDRKQARQFFYLGLSPSSHEFYSIVC